MWNIIVDLLEKWWKEKPRKDVMRAVVHLRDTMRNCQAEYKRFKAIPLTGNVNDSPLWRNSHKEWVRSLTDLGLAIIDIDDVLTIFSPDAGRLIRTYFDEDYFLAFIDGTLGTAAADLNAPLHIDVNNDVMDQHFFDALEQLDTFIRANFKIEEVHAAQQSWQSPNKIL